MAGRQLIPFAASVKTALLLAALLIPSTIKQLRSYSSQISGQKGQERLA